MMIPEQFEIDTKMCWYHIVIVRPCDDADELQSLAPSTEMAGSKACISDCASCKMIRLCHCAAIVIKISPNLKTD